MVDCVLGEMVDCVLGEMVDCVLGEMVDCMNVRWLIGSLVSSSARVQ